MRAKLISLLAATAGASAVLLADPPVTGDLDFQRINAAIKEAMDPIVAESELISKFTYAIDSSHTDLDKNLYGVDMQVEGKEPWSDESFASNIKLILQHDEAASKLDAFTNLEVSTDTLAFVRHHAQKSKVCDMEPKASGAIRVALSEDCKILPRLSNVKSFDELHQILSDHIENAKATMTLYETDLKKALEIVQSEEAKQSLGAQVAESQSYLKGASEVKLTRTVDGVKLEVGEFPVLGHLDLKNMSIDFSPAKIHATGEGSTTLCSKMYRAAKPELLRILRGLERGEEFAGKLTQMETRFWLRLMESHISGQQD